MEQLFTKRMEMDKIKALKISKFDNDANMTLSEGSQQDLEWVLKKFRGVSTQINQPEIDKVIFTDASTEGWGCFDPQRKISGGGRWTADEKITLGYRIRAVDQIRAVVGKKIFF